jgi:hypothetical protein
MTVTYTTPQKVSSQLRLIDQTTQARLVFSADSDPTLDEVEISINRAEDRIDRETSHAWRAVSIANEYHSMHRSAYDSYQRAFPVYLKHRALNTLVSGTDKIELWNGSEWIDLVLIANGYTEGRADDYWIDYNQGVIYIRHPHAFRLDMGVRVTYRYGESSVPGDIEEACTKLAAIAIADTNEYSITLPEGVGEYGIASKIDKWTEDVNRILYNRREIIMA